MAYQIVHLIQLQVAEDTRGRVDRGSVSLAPVRRILKAAEFVRWAVIVVALYLSVWQYCSIVGYTLFVENVDVYVQFWIIFTIIVVILSLALYLPWRCVSYRWRHRMHAFLHDERW